MRKKKTSVWEKASFFIVAMLILVITAYTAYGIYSEGNSYMRFGIDIKGGVSATFKPTGDYDPTDKQLESAKSVIEVRLDSKNILDRTVAIDKDNNSIIVEFPWQANEKNFDPVAAINELGETAQLRFATVEQAGEHGGEGVYEYSKNGFHEHYKIKKEFMNGSNVSKATALYNGEDFIALEFDAEGTKLFPDSTAVNDYIGILMDETLISVAQLKEEITNGQGSITGNFTAKEAQDLASKINSGALPFTMESTNYSAVSATMGANALNIMMLAGLIALCIIFIFMCAYYRLPGFVASITLLLQTAGQLLIFHIMGLTLTLPGIAGIILSIGMGVDSNIIISERIKEEINAGKTLKGAISAGYDRAFSAVLDCNVTTGVIGVLLIIFGTGAMLSFAYTLLIGIVLNFGLSILSSKIMIQSLSCYKIFSTPKFYGFKKAKEVE